MRSSRAAEARTAAEALRPLHGDTKPPAPVRRPSRATCSPATPGAAGPPPEPRTELASSGAPGADLLAARPVFTGPPCRAGGGLSSRPFPVRRAGRPRSHRESRGRRHGEDPFVGWLAGELPGPRDPALGLDARLGRGGRGAVVVSDGAGMVASGAGSGTSLHACPGASPCPDRGRSRTARRRPARGSAVPDVRLHLLDDGFSMVALARDLDVVLLDATTPDAGGRGRPCGLREPLSSLREPTSSLTKCEQADSGPAPASRRRWAPGAPVYHATTRVLGIRDGSGEDSAPRTCRARRSLPSPPSRTRMPSSGTLALAGIAPAERRRRSATTTRIRLSRSAGSRPSRGVRSDGRHHDGKDAVKLEERLGLPLFRVAVEMA